MFLVFVVFLEDGSWPWPFRKRSCESGRSPPAPPAMAPSAKSGTRSFQWRPGLESLSGHFDLGALYWCPEMLLLFTSAYDGPSALCSPDWAPGLLKRKPAYGSQPNHEKVHYLVQDLWLHWGGAVARPGLVSKQGVLQQGGLPLAFLGRPPQKTEPQERHGNKSFGIYFLIGDLWWTSCV